MKLKDMNLIEKNIKEIDIALWRERNGAVVDSMRNITNQNSILSYGVSLPTIKAICLAFEPSTELSIQLFKSSTREHKLAAIYLMPPQELSADVMCQIVLLLENVEIANVASQALLYKSPVAADVASLWLQSGVWLQKHSALMMIGRMAKQKLLLAERCRSFIDILLNRHLLTCEGEGLKNGFCYAVSNLAQYSDIERNKVYDAIQKSGSDAIKTELLWLLY